MAQIAVIADDYTGGTDAAAALRRSGLRVAMLFGIPNPAMTLTACDAVVVALKFRSIPAPEACEQVARVHTWLDAQGVEGFYYKYCSTFDSTPDGNIGQVTDRMVALTGTRLSVICPASPVHGRTTFMGHLFVGDRLLSESPLRNHPLNPMTDSDLVRWLSRQSPHRVGLLPLSTVRAGSAAVTRRLNELADNGFRHVVSDATEDPDLGTIADAAPPEALLTGGAGLVEAWGRTIDTDWPTALSPGDAAGQQAPAGTLLIAGSCSEATLEQIARAQQVMPAFRVDPAECADPAELTEAAVAWEAAQDSAGLRLVYSSATPAQRERTVAAMGPDTPQLLEKVLSTVAARSVGSGTRRVVVAGGETSGAVVSALGVEQVLVGTEAAPGVPWCSTVSDDPVTLLLKSGNFGSPDFLIEAAAR